MKKNPITFVAFSLLALGIVGLAGASGSFAQQSTDSTPTFLERVADKLELPSEKIEGAYTEVRGEIHQERVSEALTSSSLTQEQAALLQRIHDYRVATLGQPGQQRMMMREELSGLGFEERKTQMEAHRKTEIASLAEALGVSVEEIEAVQQAARDAGLGSMGMGGHGHGGGKGMMGGMHRGGRNR